MQICVNFQLMAADAMHTRFPDEFIGSEIGSNLYKVKPCLGQLQRAVQLLPRWHHLLHKVQAQGLGAAKLVKPADPAPGAGDPPKT